MDEKEKKQREKDRQNTYMFTIIGLFHLYVWGKFIVDEAAGVSGWEWLSFIIGVIVAFLYISFIWDVL